VRDHKVTAETVVFACCCALAAVAVMPAVPWFLPAAEVILGVVVMCSAWATTGAAFLSLFWGSFGAALAIWSIWVSGRLWSVASIFIWFVITVVAAPTAVHAARKATRVPPAPGEAPQLEDGLTSEQRELANWDYMFEQVGCPGVKTTEIRHERSGRILRLRLPREGKLQSIETLENARKKIEIIMELRPNAVSFDHGDHSADIWMRLREKNVMADITRLTAERLARTVNEKFAIGVQEDGNVSMISMRELHMMIAGTTGSGKSNLLNVLITQLASMTDTLIWVIDMKGGRTARPWLQAWSDGLTAKPAIDWVATTRSEAMLMMKAFEEVIDERANSGVGGSKITPSPEMPQIILVCDEMASLFGQNKGKRSMVKEEEETNSWFISKAETLTQMGRSEAVASIWATQRATVTMAASGDLKANCTQRIALATASQQDARSIIPDNPRELRLLTSLNGERGAGLVTLGSKSSMLTKFFFHDHLDGQCSENGNDGCVPDCPVWASSIEVGKHRPNLDRLTAGRLGEVYANRWSRAGNLIRRRTAAQGGSGGGTTVIDDSEIRDSFEAIMSQETAPEDPDGKVDPARKRMRELLIERGEKGSTAILLKQALERENLDRARETISRWLALDAELGLAHSKPEYGRWGAGPDPGNEADGDAA
jgi:hypothetical protein